MRRLSPLVIPSVVLLCLTLSGAPVRASEPPVRLILDTDIGNDVDDAMALSMIHSLQDRGECELLAVTVTKDNPYAAPAVDVFNTYHGRSSIPIGAVRRGATPDDGKYLKELATAERDGRPRWPHALKRGEDAPEAVAVLRKTLAAQADGAVVIVQVGFCTNLARLLESGPDALSPLGGLELVKKKVRLLSLMGGGFGPNAAKNEYNVVTDLPSARKLFSTWPTPVVASGFEVGSAILHSGRSMRSDYRWAADDPLVFSYEHYRGLGNDQPTWDLTSVLYAVRPDRGYFDLSPAGVIAVESDGRTTFTPKADGPHRYLIVRPEQIVRAREAQELLCSQPPHK